MEMMKMFEFLKVNNKLKRDDLISITQNFIDSINEYPIFEIPDKNYLDYFKELKQKLNQYELKEDERFVTYGRLSFLKNELTERLKDEKLKEPDPNWKDKWDNRMGAFWDLSDYIRGDRYISIGQVPNDVSFHEILRKNDEYYKEGFICKQEKEVIIEMINEIEEYIYQKNSKEENKMGLFDKFSKKYNINPEDNMPQIVYGPPAEFITKETDIKFEFYEGGYFGPCECYRVEKKGDMYKFKAGYSSAGRPNLNDDKSLDIVIKGETDYTKFIKELQGMISNWEEHYSNPGVMDGTQWHLKIEEFNIDCGGSNAFPQNYKKVKKYITKNFNCKFNIDNYEIDPEDNVPREVYGIPSPVQKELDKEKDKYEVNPEKNVPQRVYGVPSPTKVYGVMNPEKFKLDLDKRNKESISVIIDNYCLSLTKWGNTCDLLFVNKSKESFIKDSIVSIPLDKFDIFIGKINPIVSEWKNEYLGTKNIKWQVKFNTKQLNKTIVGNGEYPVNWNKFVDLISEYEVLFKKTINYNNKENNVNLNTSFEEMVKAKVNDPFWEKLICDYLKQEINKSETVLKIIFKDLIKYDDIFNEFTKYLVQKTYDIPGAISVEGYTAKQISELNPDFKATGVYTFLNYLREKPAEAKGIIKKGFPNKDAIPPVKKQEGYLKLVHTPFQGCYGTTEELEKMKRDPIVYYYKPELKKTMSLDKVLVTVDELTHEYIKLTIPFEEGMIVDSEQYKLRQPTVKTLKLGEKFYIHLDVYDAMENWEISYVEKKEDDENNKLKTISAIEKIGTPTSQHENTIIFISKDNAAIDNQKQLITNEKFEKICNLIYQNTNKFREIVMKQLKDGIDNNDFTNKRKIFIAKMEMGEFIIDYHTGTETDQYISNLINQIIGILKSDDNDEIKKINFGKSKIVINETYIDENGHEVDKERTIEVGDDIIIPAQIITKDDWHTEPMPEDNVEFEMERLLTINDINILKRGHKPEAMEDKWFWYVEDNILNIHRSWTGACLFKVELNTNGKLKVVSNRNPEQYKETDIEKDKEWINKLLNHWTKDNFNYYEQFIEETHENLIKQGLITSDENND